jgi:hypothetical protein
LQVLPAGEDFAACRDLWTDMETIQATIPCELHTGFALRRKSRSASGTYLTVLRHVAPSPPIFLRMQRGLIWQRSCKKLGERAGARGPVGHLLPEGQKGLRSRSKH